MSLTGDFRTLQRTVEQLAAMKDAVPETAKAAASAIQPIIDAHAAAGTGPYGQAWAPLKASTIRVVGSHPPLNGLNRVAKTRARSSGEIIASVTRKVPRFHQVGRKASAKTGFMPARPFIPPNAGAIPDDWLSAIETSANDAMAKRAAELR